MSRIGKAALVGGAALAALMGTTTPAAAVTAPAPTAAYVGPVLATPGGVVTLKISYTCTSVVSPANHMFIAVKQGATVNTTDHSSSQYADAFYSTNWKSDAGPNALTCNGQPQLQTVVLKTQPAEFGWTEKAPLHSGQALVQVCVYDNITGFVNGEPVGGSATPYTMQTIRAVGA
jgi:hypothetical protein